MCGQTKARRTAAVVLDQMSAPGIIPPTQRALLHSDFYVNEMNKSESQQMDMQLAVSWAICCRSKKMARADPGPVTCADVLMRHASPLAPVADTPLTTHEGKWDPKWKLWSLAKKNKTTTDTIHTYMFHLSLTKCKCTCGHMWSHVASQATHRGQQKGGGQEVESHRVHGSVRIQEKIHKWHVHPLCVRGKVFVCSRLFHKDLLILLTAAQHIGL